MKIKITRSGISLDEPARKALGYPTRVVVDFSQDGQVLVYGPDRTKRGTRLDLRPGRNYGYVWVVERDRPKLGEPRTVKPLFAQAPRLAGQDAMDIKLALMFRPEIAANMHCLP